MSLQGLDAYTLPGATIGEQDIPGIKTIIQQVLDKLRESTTSAGSRADNETIKSCLLGFQDWMGAQTCISQVSTTYNIEATDTYADSIFMTHPGQLPFDIVFNMNGNVQKQYRLLIFITAYDLFTFASLVENKSLGGVDFPLSWPKDSWTYWDDRP